MSLPSFPEPLLRCLRSARQVTVLTGAGISAESGIPTFRDSQTGLWSKYRAEDLATPEAFRKNPKLVWQWYAWRRHLIAQAQPNAGHLALARMEAFFPKFSLITQNVDGLHQRAGSRNVIELHGNIDRVKCFTENCVIEAWTETDEIPPCCPRCGALLRPDVVWFGETLPSIAWQAAVFASECSQVFFSIGTSSLVEPAARLPVLALQAKAILVEINPSRTPVSPSADYVLNGTAGDLLPALVNLIGPGTHIQH